MISKEKKESIKLHPTPEKRKTTKKMPRLKFSEKTRKQAQILEQRVHHPTRQKQIKQEPIPSYLPKRKSEKPKVEENFEVPQQIDKTLLLNNPRLIAMRTSLTENYDISHYTHEELNQLAEHLREYSAFCALQREYDEAADANKLYEKIRSEIQVTNINELCGINDESVPYSELKRAKQQQFMDDLKEYDYHTTQKRDELEARLNEELEEFEFNWKENMPRKYRKPSTKLLELYEIERRFGLTGKFEEAKKVKAEADALQAVEMNQAQKRLVHDYTVAKSKFDQQQEKERKIFEETREHWRAIMISKHNLEMENLLNRKNVLSIKQNESKCVKESSIDPPKVDKFNNGGAAVYRRENVAPKDILLPPLIAPNDDRIKDMQMKEIEIQRNKNQQFRAYQKQKEIEDNRSDFSSRQNSARSGRSDLLPPPKLYIKKEKNSARTKKISPSGSGYSTYSEQFQITAQQLDVCIDPTQIQNAIKEQFKCGFVGPTKSARNDENDIITENKYSENGPAVNANDHLEDPNTKIQ